MDNEGRHKSAFGLLPVAFKKTERPERKHFSFKKDDDAKAPLEQHGYPRKAFQLPASQDFDYASRRQAASDVTSSLSSSTRHVHSSGDYARPSLLLHAQPLKHAEERQSMKHECQADPPKSFYPTESTSPGNLDQSFSFTKPSQPVFEFQKSLNRLQPQSINLMHTSGDYMRYDWHLS